MSAAPVVTRIGPGVYRVDIDGRAETVHVAGTPGHRWAHWRGRVFERPFAVEHQVVRRGSAERHQSLSAPMPATVLKLVVAVGSEVRKGDTLLILEAMKMELPVRAPADAVVRSIRCREGELVQPGTTLVELE